MSVPATRPQIRFLTDAERDAKVRKMGYRDWQDFCNCAEAMGSGPEPKPNPEWDAVIDRVEEWMKTKPGQFEPNGRLK